MKRLESVLLVIALIAMILSLYGAIKRKPIIALTGQLIGVAVLVAIAGYLILHG